MTNFIEATWAFWDPIPRYAFHICGSSDISGLSFPPPDGWPIPERETDYGFLDHVQWSGANPLNHTVECSVEVLPIPVWNKILSCNLRDLNKARSSLLRTLDILQVVVNFGWFHALLWHLYHEISGIGPQKPHTERWGYKGSVATPHSKDTGDAAPFFKMGSKAVGTA